VTKGIVKEEMTESNILIQENTPEIGNFKNTHKLKCRPTCILKPSLSILVLREHKHGNTQRSVG
jgi:hypothetical protein